MRANEYVEALKLTGKVIVLLNLDGKCLRVEAADFVTVQCILFSPLGSEECVR